jgi:hypothetical protein
MIKIGLLALLGVAIIAGILFFLLPRRETAAPITSSIPDGVPAKPATPSDDAYFVNLDSIRRVLPTGVTMPAKLEKFLAWIKLQPSGSVGHIGFTGNHFDDYWIENGSNLAEKLFLFAKLGDGTTIGYWLYDGRTIDTAPIVLIGSEGELEILANSLEEFLGGLVNDSFSNHSDLSAESDDEEPQVDRRPQLATFLAGEFGFTVNGSADYSEAAKSKHPGLQQWMDDWAAEQQRLSRADPTRRAIAEITKTRWTKLKEPWDHASIDLFVAGGTVRQQIHRNTKEPIAELEKLAPHILALRDAELKSMPQRGTFHFISLRIHQGGHVALMRQDHFKELGTPDVNTPEGALPGILADAKAYPRSAYWTPQWLAKLIVAG